MPLPIPRLFLTLKKWFFPQEEHRNEKQQKTVFAYRIEKPIEARVIHQYPKQGNFRFPLIQDDFSQKVSTREHPSTHSSSNIVEKEEYSSQKTTLDNELIPNFFQRGVSPSPIYGYRNRPEKCKNTILAKEQKTPHQTKKEISETTTAEMDDPSNNETETDDESTTNVADPLENTSFVNGEVAATVMKQEDIQKEFSFTTQQETNMAQSEINKTDRTIEPVVRLPRAERRRLERLKKKNMKSEKKPYNVVMLTKEKEQPAIKQNVTNKQYEYPAINLLTPPLLQRGVTDDWVTSKVKKLNETFTYFNIKASVVHVTKGPAVTRFEIQPQPGVKVSKITNLTDDLKLSLAAKEIRMEAPIPGKNTIGIEVPNDIAEPVFLRDILQHPIFQKKESPLIVALGKDIEGEPVVTDLQKMPHGLIAGATGSGKSVCVNSILVSLLYKATPKDVRLLLIDPKMVELAPYNGMPHLAAPVITDPKEATEGLKWAVSEMDRRYELFAREGTRDLKRYNEKQLEKRNETLPYLVIVVDELADLMMVAPNDVEEAICRIAQKARACGIHLIVATQRPSVDVITGLIKANIPTRIAFSVASQADSRTILDGAGAERLLGKGDMLFLENGSSKPIRVQGAFVSDEEIDRVMDHVKSIEKPAFMFKREMLQHQINESSEDDLFETACEFVMEQQAASASLLQRQFRIGYNRAARLIDEMEDRGIISPTKGSKPREVYLTKAELNGKIEGRGES